MVPRAGVIVAHVIGDVFFTRLPVSDVCDQLLLASPATHGEQNRAEGGINLHDNFT